MAYLNINNEEKDIHALYALEEQDYFLLVREMSRVTMIRECLQVFWLHIDSLVGDIDYSDSNSVNDGHRSTG